MFWEIVGELQEVAPIVINWQVVSIVIAVVIGILILEWSTGRILKMRYQIKITVFVWNEANPAIRGTTEGTIHSWASRDPVNNLIKSIFPENSGNRFIEAIDEVEKKVIEENLHPGTHTDQEWEPGTEKLK